MSNDPRADLIYALLTLDSYNRGYGKGIKGLDETGPGAKIGSYSIVPDIPQTDWKTAGFYAIAYRNGNDVNAETIIAYRGNYGDSRHSPQYRTAALRNGDTQ